MSKRKTRPVDRSPSDNTKRLNEAGQETLDDTPVTLPVRFMRGENIADRVQQLVEKELSRRAENAGYETLDDANDFYIPGDDYDPRSPHEVDEYAEEQYLQQRDNRDSGWFKRTKASPPEGTGETTNPGEPPAKPTQTSDKPNPSG